jgi:DNA-binding GntR family transcriptional regulator
MSTDAKTEADMDVAARLRVAIETGQFLPNERLIEADLASAYGTNRTSIRNAFAHLEQERLIVREPNRGARVRLLSDTEAIEIYEARGALEALVARQAALRVTPEGCDRLNAIIAEMESVHKARNPSALSALNGVLHAELRTIAGNSTLTRLLEGLRSHIVRFQYRTFLVPGRADDTVAEHRRIVEAVCARKPEMAETAMRLHLGNVTENLREAMAHVKTAPF